MDMKRVEELSNHYQLDRERLPSETGIKYDDLVFLIQTIKQQQELLEQLVGEETLHQSGEYETEMKRLHDRVVRYKKALDFYANPEVYKTDVESQWEPNRMIDNDEGNMAQQALVDSL